MPDQSRRPRPAARGVPNALIGVAILAELVLLIGHLLVGWGPSPDYRPTPSALIFRAPTPPSAAAVLERLAAVAVRQPALAAGRYAYVKRRGWRLAAGRSRTAATAAVTQSWLAPDGSGRIVQTTAGTRRTSVRELAAGSGHTLPSLSTSPAALGRLLGLGSPPGDGREFAALAAVTSDQPIAPRTQAAVLGLLARIPSLVNLGTVVDRAGRSGVAIGLSPNGTGAPVRDTVVFSPATGALLEFDETLEGDGGALQVRPGAVLAYTTFLAAGDVASPEAVAPRTS